ncbi:MAG: glycosyltransferase [Chloroflexota bacterium]
MAKPVVLFTALREPAYVRNALALRSLKTCFAVRQITSDAPTYPRRLASVLPRLATQVRGHDLCFAGFLGQPLAIWLRLCQRRPIVLDAFVSVYDTLCFDRRAVPTWSPITRLAYWLDYLAAACAAVVVVDTDAHAEYFSKTFLIPRHKIETVYVGYDPAIFLPLPHEKPVGSPFQVFSYSSYLPVHGMDNVVRAARLLKSETQIAFTLVGTGPTYSTVRHLARQLDLPNVSFVDWIPYQRLPTAIASADICLGGHFAASGKAQRTIAGKTFQFLAMGKPTIVGDCAANHELLLPGEHAMFCKQSSPEALAQVILGLVRSPDLRQHLGSKGEELVRERFSPEVVTERWASIMRRALA